MANSNFSIMAIINCEYNCMEMTNKYLKQIKRLLKAYHKKYDCFGKERKKKK